MAEKSVLQKMGVKPGQSVLILNAPDGSVEKLGAEPGQASTKAKPGDQFDMVQLFAINQAELQTHLKHALDGLKPGGMLWLAYPKISSKIKTDITRDKGWDAVIKAGFMGVSLVSIDETWSAMRFRPAGETKSTRAREMNFAMRHDIRIKRAAALPARGGLARDNMPVGISSPQRVCRVEPGYR